MELLVNGKKMQCDSDATVSELLTKLDIEPGAAGMAVAVNGAVVPRSRWGETDLAGGDKVEIIQAVQGG